MMNLFQPCIQLQTKVRKGLRLIRQYDTPQTPLDRLLACQQGKPALAGKRALILDLERQRTACDPFVLAKTIDRQIEAIWDLANPRYSPGTNVG